MSQPCPLTKNYVQGLSKYIAEDVETLLYESLIEEFNTLAERAETAGSEIRVVQLRAFIAVEIMYQQLVEYYSSYIDTSNKNYILNPPARSWAGLTELVRTFSAAKDNIDADRMERAIIGEEIKNDTTLIVRANEESKIGLYEYIVQSAIWLRRALRRRDAEQIPVIGTYLAKACEEVDATPTNRVRYLRLLVDTTEEQAGRAWERLTT